MIAPGFRDVDCCGTCAHYNVRCYYCNLHTCKDIYAHHICDSFHGEALAKKEHQKLMLHIIYNRLLLIHKEDPIADHMFYLKKMIEELQ
jgi:hypothetical protein